MDNLDLNLLRVFDAIWRHGHVGRAAQSMGLSQPAFSYSLKRLREQMGDPLFIKTRSGMLPTTQAERIAPLVSALLEQIRTQLVAPPVFDAITSDHTFVLCTSDIGEMVMLPKLLRHLAKVAPNIRIRMFNARHSDLVLAMENGQVDLLLGYFPDAVGADIFQQRLYSHNFLCLARKGHPGITEKISKQDFVKLPHAVIRAEGRSQEIVEHAFKKHRIIRHEVLHTHHFLSVPFVVAATDIIVTVPAAVGEMFSRLANIQTFRPPIQLPSFDIKQYWHRRQHKDPANTWFRSQAKLLFGGKAGWHLDDD